MPQGNFVCIFLKLVNITGKHPVKSFFHFCNILDKKLITNY